MHLCSQYDMIIVSVDARGSGCQGTAYRYSCYRRLGIDNEEDYTAFIKDTVSNWEFVDPERIMIYGWSFGGYITLRTISMTADTPFKFAISVAPVTDWFVLLPS